MENNFLFKFLLDILLLVHKEDNDILADLFLTIAALTVRHEFCVQVEEAGGLKFIYDCMVMIQMR